MQVNEKFEKLKQLKNYIENVDVRTNNILNHLGWNKEYTFKKFNSEQQNTKWSKMNSNYNENFTQLHNIKLETNVIQKLLNESVAPHISKQPNEHHNSLPDKQMCFSREQKLKIYDFIIEKTGKLTEPERFLISESLKTSHSNKLLSFAEIFALRRDFKRRRLKHSVGTNSPLSVIEEFRNLIELQMDAFKEYNNQIINKETNEKKNHKSSYFQNKDCKKKVEDKNQKYANENLQKQILKEVKKSSTEYTHFPDKNTKSGHKTKHKEKKTKNRQKLESHSKSKEKDRYRDKILKDKKKDKNKDRSSEKYSKLKKRKKDKKNKRKVDD